jgi:hypothetical protein
MSKPRQFLVLVLLCVTPFTIPHHRSSAAADDETTWVVSDDPCGPGQSATVPAGSDYRAGVWYGPDGASIGWATEEDECVNLATDDLAVSARTTDAAQPATLPVTL